MTIDTSPEALPELRMYAGGYSAPDVILALIDALEEARANLEQCQENYRILGLAYADFKRQLPAIPPETKGDDKHETAQDASARNRRFNWDEPSR